MTYIYFIIYLFKHENILLWLLIFEVAIATSLLWRISPLMGLLLVIGSIWAVSNGVIHHSLQVKLD